MGVARRMALAANCDIFHNVVATIELGLAGILGGSSLPIGILALRKTQRTKQTQQKQHRCMKTDLHGKQQSSP